jgi:hypothetical protein
VLRLTENIISMTLNIFIAIKMRLTIFVIAALILCCNKTNNQVAQKPVPAVNKANVVSSADKKPNQIVLNGNYSAEFDFQGGNYKVTYSFNGDKYSSKLLFENEDVSKCEGIFSVHDKKLLKTKRIYAFIRSENPGSPTPKEDLEQEIRNPTDSTFELNLTKESEEGFSDSIWVNLKKK